MCVMKVVNIVLLMMVNSLIFNITEVAAVDLQRPILPAIRQGSFINKIIMELVAVVVATAATIAVSVTALVIYLHH